MTNPDTSIGGRQGSFETTAWSMIQAFQSGDESDRRAAMERLIEQYWKPVYYFIRLQWRKSNADSKDLTQLFFAHLLEGGTLDQLAQERGRFRAFIRVALKNFLTNAYHADRALKRGGGRPLVSLQQFEDADRDLPDESANPADVLDREWKRALMTQGLERLRLAYDGAGKPVRYELFQRYYIESKSALTHAQLAAHFGVSEVEVNNTLADARRRLKRIVFGIVRESVTNEAEFQL